VNWDGLNLRGAYNGGGLGFAPDPSAAEEMQVTLAGQLGQAETGSAMINFGPKSGGNTFKGPRMARTRVRGWWGTTSTPP
jgi:hypothetical protein